MGARGKIRHFLYKTYLRYQLDILVDIRTKQLDIQVWSLREKSSLEI